MSAGKSGPDPSTDLLDVSWDLGLGILGAVLQDALHAFTLLRGSLGLVGRSAFALAQVRDAVVSGVDRVTAITPGEPIRARPAARGPPSGGFSARQYLAGQ